MAASVIIWVKPDYQLADPICTFVFAIVVLCTTAGLARDLTDIIMERVPRSFDLPGLRAALCGVSGVSSIHDLHVWAIKPGMLILAVHVDMVPGHSPTVVLRSLTEVCRDRGVGHVTVQLTAHGEVCPCDPKAGLAVQTITTEVHPE